LGLLVYSMAVDIGRGWWTGELLPVGFEEEVMGEEHKATKVVKGEGKGRRQMFALIKAVIILE
jgi:hypothetical protein